MTRPDDIPESPEQAATRIAGEFLGAPVSCELIYKLVYAALLSAQAEATEAAAFQHRVAQAHHALFHDDPTDIAERRDRFCEEANEVGQALGLSREEAHQLVDYTYFRPVGEPEKEIGAAALTLASLCVVGGWDMAACAEADLAALQTPEKIAKIRAKRATRHGRGPLPGLSPASLPPAHRSE